MNAYDIILKPVMSEKAYDGIHKKIYTFKVARNANKIEIKQAVEQIFGVKVESVNTVNVRGINRLAKPDTIHLESDLALIAVVGRGMKSTRGTAGRLFSALAHAHINVKMIDQGSSELNIIIGVNNEDFEDAIRAIYDIFVVARL